MHCFSAKYTFPQNRNLQKPKLGLKRSRLQENALRFSKQSVHGFHSVQRPQDALKITHFGRITLLFSPFINSSQTEKIIRKCIIKTSSKFDSVH